MIFVQPKERTADQEAPDFLAPIIKDAAVPLRVKAFSGIGMFEEMGPIEKTQAVFVIREMRGHPVKNDPNPR